MTSSHSLGEQVTLADANLAPYLEQAEKNRRLTKEGQYVTMPLESPHLSFLQSLWGSTPQSVFARNGPYVIGRVHPNDISQKSDNHREGIWNAANGVLEFGPDGAVCIAWNLLVNQIGVWRESDYDRQRASKWIFERYTWPTREVLSSLNLRPADYWPYDLSFPNKYKGRVAKLVARIEHGPRILYVRCADDGEDREITQDEANALVRG